MCTLWEKLGVILTLGIIYTYSQQRKDSKTKSEEGVVCTCREFAGTFSSLIRGLKCATKCATRCRLLGTLAFLYLLFIVLLTSHTVAISP